MQSARQRAGDGTGGNPVIAPVRTPETPETTGPPAAEWSRFARRVGWLGLLWWVLSGGDLESWLIGGPLVGWTAWQSLVLWPALPFDLVALLRFVPFFVSQSLAAAIDVAWRALRPTMPLRPELVRVPLRLPAGAPQVALANVITLLLGTLSAELGE